MDKYKSKYLAENVNNEQLKQMFSNAKNGITDWTEISTVNKSLTKGSAWNILAKDFNPSEYYSILIKTNMIREFGDFLPKGIISETSENIRKNPNAHVFHEEPIFDNYI